MKKGYMKRSMRALFRRIELETGDASERYLHSILESAQQARKLPPWLKGWKRSQKWSESDRHGVDFMIFTDRGSIRINVKSSQIFAKQFQDRHKDDDILAVVMNTLECPETSLGRFISIIGGEYRKMPVRA